MALGTLSQDPHVHLLQGDNRDYAVYSVQELGSRMVWDWE